MFFSTLSIYFERETEHKWRRGRERGRKRIPSKLCTASAEPDTGLELTDREIVTWLKSDA